MGRAPGRRCSRGTGRLGRLVVPRLGSAGCDVRVLTRRGREATRRLVEAATRAGSPHLVYVSIVGIDHLPAWGYPKASSRRSRS